MNRRIFAFFWVWFLPAALYAQAPYAQGHDLYACVVIKPAFDNYINAEFEQAERELQSLRDEDLGSDCKAEKYMLMGAIDVVSYMSKKSNDFEAADRDFVVSLLSDPFRMMTSRMFPALLIRNRFEYNRRKLNQGDVQASISEPAPDAEAALINAESKAVRNYLSRFFSAERFQDLQTDPSTSEALLSVSHARRSKILDQKQSENGIQLDTSHLIDRTSILYAANKEGVLFDIEKPYVRLDITETIDTAPSQSRIALTSIKQALQQAGFTVIDESTPNNEAHILIRGNVDASSERLGLGLGYGGWAISNLTMRWADGSNYEFGSHIEKKDGKGKMNQREASFSALEGLTTALTQHIKQTCLEQWNSRALNGAIHLVEVEGSFAYEDFRRLLTQISTFALNDPLDNPRFVANGTTQIYIRHRPQDGDLAEIIRREGFFNLSKPYVVTVSQVSFNHIKLNVQPK